MYNGGEENEEEKEGEERGKERERKRRGGGETKWGKRKIYDAKGIERNEDREIGHSCLGRIAEKNCAT